jgi:hypothetical protein
MGILNLLFKRRRKMPRKQMFGGLPVRNPSAKTETIENGLKVTLTRDQTQMPWYVRLMPKPPPVRTFELDGVGAFVWNLCDGEHTVGQIADALADEKNLEVREAEVALMNYLRTLSRRGIIGISFEEADQEQA